MMYFYATVLSSTNGIPTYSKHIGDHLSKSDAITYLSGLGIILCFIELTKEEHDVLKQNVIGEETQ